MTLDSSDSSMTYDPGASRRRGLLLLSACSLLAVGIGINVYRFAPRSEPFQAVATVAQEADGGRYAGQEVGGVRYAALPETPSQEFEQAQRHKGEEGKMGRPSPKQKSGLYAMKGPRATGLPMAPPRDVVPQMARNFDPELAARNAGILGQMQQESGHFLASPYGGSFAVGSDDQDVWGGLGGGEVEPAWDVENYDQWLERAFVRAAADAVSTFSIDVDTGAYSLVRKSLLSERRLPSPYSVRIEEMINYFDYDYPEPRGEVPLSITAEVGPCPWDDAHRLVHVGLQGKHVAPAAVPPRNLVFLIDVSGSMGQQMPLVVSSLAYLTEQLGERDRISIVVYAGAAGTVLPPTAGSDKARILGALERLEAGGSTNGGEGIELAYALAAEHFVEGGINRVMLATDGDFNVGTTSREALEELIEAKRESGVFLSVLGFGGSNYQDVAMEQLADKGNGNYAYIDGLAEARKVLVEQAGATLVTIAKDVKIQVEFDPKLVEGYRLVGYTNRVLADRDFADDTKDAGEIGAGHTVTALYEVMPRTSLASDDALLELKLRYKDPAGDRSRLVQVPVTDAGASLGQTSDDFRFSAAVAGFGQALQKTPSKVGGGSLEDLRDLARDARGDDRHCRRAELLGLIEQASALGGHPLTPASVACQPTDEPRPVTYAEPLSATDAATATDAPKPTDAVTFTFPTSSSTAFDLQRFVLEVLYLLPPLLALPLFFMALRRPRRRR